MAAAPCSLPVPATHAYFARCTNAYPTHDHALSGGELSAFPNSEEKFQHLLHNLHRMHSNNTLYTPLGGRTAYFSGVGADNCGSTPDRAALNARAPLYWYSDANQAARFKQWDASTCNESWYGEPGRDAHSTCRWGLDELTTWGAASWCSAGSGCTTPRDRCELFTPLASNETDCSDDSRFLAFIWDDADGCWPETETLCEGNACVTDADCEPIFAPTFDYVGKGFVAGMDGAAALYMSSCADISYVLPAGLSLCLSDIYVVCRLYTRVVTCDSEPFR